MYSLNHWMTFYSKQVTFEGYSDHSKGIETFGAAKDWNWQRREVKAQQKRIPRQTLAYVNFHTWRRFKCKSRYSAIRDVGLDNSSWLVDVFRARLISKLCMHSRIKFGLGFLVISIDLYLGCVYWSNIKWVHRYRLICESMNKNNEQF